MKSIVLVFSLFAATACSPESTDRDEYDLYFGPTPAVKIDSLGFGDVSMNSFSLDTLVEQDPTLTAECPHGNPRCESGATLDIGRNIVGGEGATYSMILHGDGEGFGLIINGQADIDHAWGTLDVLSDVDCGDRVGISSYDNDFDEAIVDWTCLIVN